MCWRHVVLQDTNITFAQLRPHPAYNILHLAEQNLSSCAQNSSRSNDFHLEFHVVSFNHIAWISNKLDSSSITKRPTSSSCLTQTGVRFALSRILFFLQLVEKCLAVEAFITSQLKQNLIQLSCSIQLKYQQLLRVTSKGISPLKFMRTNSGASAKTIESDPI